MLHVKIKETHHLRYYIFIIRLKHLLLSGTKNFLILAILKKGKKQFLLKN